MRGAGMLLAGPRGRGFGGLVDEPLLSSIEILKEFERGEIRRTADSAEQIDPALPSILDHHTASWTA
jgi:hypothetical protein